MERGERWERAVAANVEKHHFFFKQVLFEERWMCKHAVRHGRDENYATKLVTNQLKRGGRRPHNAYQHHGFAYRSTSCAAEAGKLLLVLRQYFSVALSLSRFFPKWQCYLKILLVVMEAIIEVTMVETRRVINTTEHQCALLLHIEQKKKHFLHL